MRKFVLIVILLCGIVPCSGGTIYVDADAQGANNGSNWAEAFNFLQDALTAAVSGDTVKVAQGTYKPDTSIAYPNGTGDRDSTFLLKNGVAIQGGYAGYGQSDPNARDISVHETILSGDLYGNDVAVSEPCDLPTEPTRAENSYHVVTGSSIDSTSILEGFTITKGNANNYPYRAKGGGMRNDDSYHVLTNCTFSGNSASGSGGGMYNYSSSPSVFNCAFNDNYGGDGGGGMCNDYVCSTSITNCTFTGNSANDGGGMYNAASYPTLTNCTFSGNSANNGGGMYDYCYSSSTITDCTFRGNSASGSGGGICDIYDNNPIITNCILWGNTAPAGAQIYSETSSLTVSFSDIEGGWEGTGNIDANPLFVDANGPDGIVGTEDDNLRLLSDSPCIDTANNSSVLGWIETDLDGRNRFADGDCNATVIVDMGAYELSWVFWGDFDSDCDIDFFDFAILANSWLQNDPLRDIAPPPVGDGIVDIYDLAVLCDNWLAGK